jgi:hypothetical protein
MAGTQAVRLLTLVAAGMHYKSYRQSDQQRLEVKLDLGGLRAWRPIVTVPVSEYSFAHHFLPLRSSEVGHFDDFGVRHDDCGMGWTLALRHKRRTL